MKNEKFKKKVKTKNKNKKKMKKFKNTIHKKRKIWDLGVEYDLSDSELIELGIMCGEEMGNVW